ncbi:MAG: type II secretion system protein [Fimbriimonadaceae bacterium]|nr:type II secretion system protein [Fimbriimonadaceae bacterium]
MGRRTKRNLDGFTITELLCVIGIIACLSALLYPSLAEAQKAAEVGSCLANLRGVQQALRQYSIDYDDRVPRGKDCVDAQRVEVHPKSLWQAIEAMPLLSELVLPYTKSRGLWRCPLDTGTAAIDTLPSIPLQGKPTLFAACGMSYGYVTSLGMGASWTSLERVSEQVTRASTRRTC